jgi:NAD(P)-dependent dehydrogenase (short-subunit alcohol dehydrogenase family)
MSLVGKTALITGGTSGIGFATAKLFLGSGARVVITGQDQGRLDSACLALGQDASGVRADVRDLTALAQLGPRAAALVGPIDILFANAGVAFATPLGTTDAETFDALMEVNVRGVFFTLQSVVPQMRDGGSVILNTSWLADIGTAGLAALSASKAAVRSFARTLSRELLPRSIRVNCVSPGATNTPIHAKTGMSDSDLAAFAAHLQAVIPLGRFGEVAEVAEAALFLAGNGSRYMLGAEIAVDGGFAQL